jgi:hypothetical protein
MHRFSQESVTFCISNTGTLKSLNIQFQIQCIPLDFASRVEHVQTEIGQPGWHIAASEMKKLIGENRKHDFGHLRMRSMFVSSLKGKDTTHAQMS